MTIHLRHLVGSEHTWAELCRREGRLHRDPTYAPVSGRDVLSCTAYRGTDDRLFERLVRPTLVVEWYEVGEQAEPEMSGGERVEDAP
jgi:hypothetical protein